MSFQLCPKCNGEKQVPLASVSGSTTAFRVCPVCLGAGIIESDTQEWIWTDYGVTEFIHFFFPNESVTPEKIEAYKQWCLRRTTQWDKKEDLEYFFKETPKPDWRDQIVAYRYNGIIYKRNILTGEFVAPWSTPIHKLILHTEDMKEIYTVRNSKGEEFTVGDETNYGKIESFDYFNITSEVHAYFPRNGSGQQHVAIDDQTKKTERKPLFTTEDGKEIFEGDEYWIIFDDLEAIEPRRARTKIPERINDYSKGFDSGKTFSSEEAMLKYVSENKPSISYRELEEYLDNHNYFFGEKQKLLSHFKPSKP